MSMHLHTDDVDGELSEINVTPLVDVMLVLLVVFIVTAPLLTQAVRVKLPKTDATEPAPDQHIAILSVAADGQPMLDDRPVRHAYFGEEVQRFIREREEVKIMVRHPEAERRSTQDLKTLPIRLPDGSQAPLGSLVELSYAPGFGALNRENRRGLVTLHARLDESAPKIGKEIFKELEAGLFATLENSYPSLEISAGASSEEADLIMDGLKRNTVLAMLAIYAVIAISFRSYLQPLLFMLAIPIAWLGAVLIHCALDLTMSFQSIVGMVAASGVLVNDSIVLLDYIQKRRDTALNPAEIIIEACASRFRPIVLVSLTNLAGFFPMLFETSEQAKFLVPMTLSLSFGLLFGMTATLFLVPVCYAVLEDRHTVIFTGKWRLARH